MSKKLTALRRRIKTLQPRIGHAEGDVAAADRQREKTAPWRKWYRSERWRRIRLDVLKRDGWRCRETGAPLTGKGNEPDAPVIHHMTPHGGDEQRFWDEENLVAVSKAWHDSQGQRADKAKGHW